MPNKMCTHTHYSSSSANVLSAGVFHGMPARAHAPMDLTALEDADRGVITLQGPVPTPEIRDEAEKIVRGVPGVVTVINGLVIEHAEGLPAWAMYSRTA